MISGLGGTEVVVMGGRSMAYQWGCGSNLSLLCFWRGWDLESRLAGVES